MTLSSVVDNPSYELDYSVINNPTCNLEVDHGFTGESIEITEPATGNSLGRFKSASAQDVNTVVSAAKEAQVRWAQTDFDSRGKILRKFAALLEEHAPIICAWNTRECGSVPMKAGWELQASVDQTYMCSAITHQPMGEIYPSNIPGRDNRCVHIPVGVVTVVSPWNFPLLLSLRSVLPALAMGNSVIIKPDVNSTVTGGLLIVDLMEKAGLPKAVCSLALGGPAVGQQLVAHPDTNMVAFTGSTAVGREISEVCGRMLKKSYLELGGNNALIILDDANLEGASSCAAWGSFLHQGQICMQSGRHIVHSSVAAEYTEKLKQRAQAMACGNPASEEVHLGPLINQKQADRVRRLIDESVAMGAHIVCGGKVEGQFIQPTVITNVTPDMPIFKEEIFGPVAPIVTFNDDAEAIALANGTDYGLSAAIHSANTSRANGMAAQINAGMIHINDQTVNNEYHIPFGGVKASGNGQRSGGPVNIEEFSERKWISSIESPIIYPF